MHNPLSGDPGGGGWRPGFSVRSGTARFPNPGSRPWATIRRRFEAKKKVRAVPYIPIGGVLPGGDRDGGCCSAICCRAWV